MKHPNNGKGTAVPKSKRRRTGGRSKSFQARYQMECILSRAWLQDNLPEVFAAVVAQAKRKGFKPRPPERKVPQSRVTVRLQLKGTTIESKPPSQEVPSGQSSEL